MRPGRNSFKNVRLPDFVRNLCAPTKIRHRGIRLVINETCSFQKFVINEYFFIMTFMVFIARHHRYI